MLCYDYRYLLALLDLGDKTDDRFFACAAELIRCFQRIIQVLDEEANSTIV